MNLLTSREQLFFRALIFKLVLVILLFSQNSFAQVTNGDFSAGNSGWSNTVPTGSSLAYGTGALVATSDNDGGTN